LKKENLLLVALTKLFGIRPVCLEDFNKIFAVGDKKEELRALEKEYPDIGLAKYGHKDEGFSILSLIATITRVLIGKALSFDVVEAIDKNGKARVIIIGALFYDEKRPQEIEDIEEATIDRFRKEYGIVIDNNKQDDIDSILKQIYVDSEFIVKDNSEKEIK